MAARVGQSPPLWDPSDDEVDACNLTKFADHLREDRVLSVTPPDYNALHKWSVENIPDFWRSFLQHAPAVIHPPLDVDAAVFLRNEPASGKPALVDNVWFPGRRINIAENLLRCATSLPDKSAVIFRPENSDDDWNFRQHLSFADLKQRVAAVALALRSHGVKRGDVVVGILANEPNTVIVMLAVFAVGAVWSCVSPDFGETAALNRFKQISPVLLFACPSYVYKGKMISTEGNLLKIASQLDSLRLVVAMPVHCSTSEGKVSSPRAKYADGRAERLDFDDFAFASEASRIEYEQMALDEPATISFSSGTTGLPKCIVHGAGVFLNQLKEHYLHLNLTQDSTVFFYSTTGWMMFNWLVSALALGATIVLYDGSALPPRDPLRLLVMANEENVTHFGCSARYFQALEDANLHPNDMLTETDPDGNEASPLRHLKTVMSTGSPSTAANFRFVSSFVGSNVQYVSLSGGTDILGCFALGCPWKPVYAPELQCPGLGMDVVVLDDAGESVQGVQGELVCRTPVPCMPLFFWGDGGHERYRKSYFVKYGERIWHHGDFASATSHGGLVITGRSDMTLNPGGVRIGTADIYQVLGSRIDIEDSVVVGKKSPSGDDIIVLLVVLRNGVALSDECRANIRSDLRKRLSPRHVPASILQVGGIPYTFSGKKMESAVKEIVNGNRDVRTDAMRNPEAVDLIAAVIEKVSAR